MVLIAAAIHHAYLYGNPMFAMWWREFLERALHNLNVRFEETGVVNMLRVAWEHAEYVICESGNPSENPILIRIVLVSRGTTVRSFTYTLPYPQIEEIAGREGLLIRYRGMYVTACSISSERDLIRAEVSIYVYAEKGISDEETCGRALMLAAEFSNLALKMARA